MTKHECHINVDMALTDLGRLIEEIVPAYPEVLRIDVVTDGFDVDHLVMHEPLVSWNFRPNRRIRVVQHGPKWPWWKPKTKFFERLEMREQPICSIDLYREPRASAVVSWR